MKTIFTLLLICGFSSMLLAQHTSPKVPAFGILGARWYYKNVGKNSDVVTHIYVEQSGTAIVPAFNMETRLYEDVKASRLIFYYLDADSVKVESDTLLVKSEKNGVFYYDTAIKIFNPLYTNLNNMGSESKVLTYHPFARGNMNYYGAQIFLPSPSKTTCTNINGKILATYHIENVPCWGYPLGDEIIERIGSTYYMLRFDSCRKDLYGGPLIWYYDPEIGLYEHGKTKVEECKFTEQKDTLFTSVADESITQNSINIYPSPFSKSLNIKNKTNSASSIYIYTHDGKCFYTDKLYGKGKTIINTSHWPAGVYVVKQETEDGISTRKIIKL